MKYAFLILLTFSLISCKYFETEKIPAQTFYDQEIKMIDWQEIDTYPAFSECTEDIDKAINKMCFEQQLANRIQNAIEEKALKSVHTLNDTLLMRFKIMETGSVVVEHMQVDSLLQVEFPRLQRWVQDEMDALQVTAPAYKRGIPVRTTFTLPVILKTK